MGKLTVIDSTLSPQDDLDESISIIFGANLAPSTKKPSPTQKAEPSKDDAKPIKRRPATESS